MKKLFALLALLPSLAFAEDFVATWEAPTLDIAGNPITPTGYVIYLADATGTKGTKIGGTNSTTFEFTKVKPGTYYATVTALLGTLESSPSNEVSVVVGVKPPVVVKNFKITIKGTATFTEIK